MNNEKVKAVQKYRDAHPSLQHDVAGLICNNPELIKDTGLKSAGFRVGLLMHKLSLYASGLSPADISRNISKIEMPKNRKGVLEIVTVASEAIKILESGKVLKPGVPETI